MRDNHHSTDEAADQQQNQQPRNYSLTQEFQDFYLVNNNNSNLQGPTSLYTPQRQEERMLPLVYGSTTFNNHSYDNSQWSISHQHNQQTSYYPSYEYYIENQNNLMQQPHVRSQGHYTSATPTGSVDSVNTSLDNTYFSHTPSTSGNTPSGLSSTRQTNYFPYVKSEETQTTSMESGSYSLPLQAKQSRDDSIASLTPAKTPLPSPIISADTSKRKRRASTAPIPRSSNHPTLAADTMTKKRQRIENNEDESEGTESLTVNQLEKELSFLRDDCATILIMLDSLRNAFLAGEQGDKGSDKRRRSKTVAQNTEMQREMRIAYDDLMLQVRQLEKKIENLEKKSRHLAEDTKPTDDVEKSDNTSNKKKKRRSKR